MRFPPVSPRPSSPRCVTGLPISLFCLVLTFASAAPLLAEEPIHVSDEAARKAIIRRAEASYPAFAKQFQLEGKVFVDAHVDTDGTVEKVDVVSGNAMLAVSAVAAAKRWFFSPFPGSDGKPAKVLVRLSFSFHP